MQNKLVCLFFIPLELKIKVIIPPVYPDKNFISYIPEKCIYTGKEAISYYLLRVLKTNI